MSSSLSGEVRSPTPATTPSGSKINLQMKVPARTLSVSSSLEGSTYDEACAVWYVYKTF